MDPNANLREQRKLAEKLAAGELWTSGEAERLAELVLALDEWIRSGGLEQRAG